MITTLLLSFLVTAAGLLLIGRILPGFIIEGFRAALVTAAIVQVVTVPVDRLTVAFLFPHVDTLGETVVPIAATVTGVAGIIGLWVAGMTVPGVTSKGFRSVLLAGVLLKVLTTVAGFAIGVAINIVAGSR